jgi:hypothetical protein
MGKPQLREVNSCTHGSTAVAVFRDAFWALSLWSWNCNPLFLGCSLWGSELRANKTSAGFKVCKGMPRLAHSIKKAKLWLVPHRAGLHLANQHQWMSQATSLPLPPSLPFFYVDKTSYSFTLSIVHNLGWLITIPAQPPHLFPVLLKSCPHVANKQERVVPKSGTTEITV